MGYELYDELFDYSFDDKNFNERMESLIKLHLIISHPSKILSLSEGIKKLPLLNLTSNKSFGLIQ